MSRAAPENLLTVWADLLLEVLAGAGIRDVVASPGSRSAPFVLAAARRDDLTIHPVIDERAAGFFALGIARATGVPPLLLCTSGTAPAHYYPAVIEASEASLPLVVLSADRPAELAGTGAPQTTDQLHLYGSHARFFADLGEPDPSPRALRGLARTAARAVEKALGPAPGPVHLDARARKPLEPTAPATDAGRALVGLANAIATEQRAPAPRTSLAFDRRVLTSVEHALRRAERPVLVAGPLSVDAPRGAVLAFAERAGLPLLAEASSQLRFGPPGDVVRGDAFDLWIARYAPDIVIEIGHTPTSGAYLRWLDEGGPKRRFVLGGSRFRDPSGTAAAVVLGDLATILAAIDTGPRRGSPRRHDDLRRLEEAAWSAVARTGGEWGEADAVRSVIDGLPDGALLGLGNSLPIRHADRFVRSGGPDVRVLSQRGVNGIDGWIASAAGAQRATGKPCVTILGDVAFAHDIGALALAAEARGPLVYVVLDNAGGRIFEQLPIASRDIDMTLFTTPPRVDLRAATEAFGVAHARVGSVETLRAALRDALARDGATTIVLEVPPHGAFLRRRAIRDALETT